LPQAWHSGKRSGQPLPWATYGRRSWDFPVPGSLAELEASFNSAGDTAVTRRQFVGAGAAVIARRARAQEKVALVSIALDCEMSARYPTWEQTEWNFRKGDLDEATKEYSLGAARRVAAAGGKMHFFVVGRVFEQPSVTWLEEIVKLGHGVGNHTYD